MNTTTRPESYWTTRNELVNAVLAAKLSTNDGADIFTAPGWYTQEARDLRANYETALGALGDFDKANGGAPVL